MTAVGIWFLIFSYIVFYIEDIYVVPYPSIWKAAHTITLIAGFFLLGSGLTTWLWRVAP